MNDRSSTRPVVLFAVKQEAAYFHAADVESVVSGMGQKNAASSIRTILSSRKPAYVVTCGFAGGLNPELRNGEVIGEWDEVFPEASALQRTGVKEVSFHCAERVAISAAVKAVLRAGTGKDAVEMESGVIRQVCREHQVPSATVRVVSDTAEEDLPLDFNQLMNADYTMNYGRLVFALIKNPMKVPKLVRFSKAVSHAAKQLGGVLTEALSKP